MFGSRTSPMHPIWFALFVLGCSFGGAQYRRGNEDGWCEKTTLTEFCTDTITKLETCCTATITTPVIKRITKVVSVIEYCTETVTETCCTATYTPPPITVTQVVYRTKYLSRPCSAINSSKIPKITVTVTSKEAGSTTTVTNAGSTATVTNAGSTLTLTYTITNAGSTLTTTVTNAASTTTVTNAGSTTTVTNAGSTTTVVNAGSTTTVTNPGETITTTDPGVT